MLHRPAGSAGWFLVSNWLNSRFKIVQEYLKFQEITRSSRKSSLPGIARGALHYPPGRCPFLRQTTLQVIFSGYMKGVLLKSENPSWTLYRCTLNTVLKGKNLQQLHQLHLGFALKEHKSFEVYTVPDSHKARFKFSRLSLLKRQYQEIFELRFKLRETGYSLYSRPNVVLNVDWHSPRYLIFMVIPFFRTRISLRI
jgi:hypothetical protein